MAETSQSVIQNEDGWHMACSIHDIAEFSGVGIRLHDHQLALFRTQSEFFALDNHDPFSDANVLSRGIVGDMAGEWVVASPMYKQHFSLVTGQCIENKDTYVRSWPVSIRGDKIYINMSMLGETVF